VVLVLAQESNLPRLRSTIQLLLRLSRRAQQTLDNMKNTRLEGTLQVDAAGGGAPVEVWCEPELRR